jgi:hypothetical protein
MQTICEPLYLASVKKCAFGMEVTMGLQPQNRITSEKK